MSPARTMYTPSPAFTRLRTWILINTVETSTVLFILCVIVSYARFILTTVAWCVSVFVTVFLLLLNGIFGALYPLVSSKFEVELRTITFYSLASTCRDRWQISLSTQEIKRLMEKSTTLKTDQEWVVQHSAAGWSHQQEHLWVYFQYSMQLFSSESTAVQDKLLSSSGTV